MRTFSSLQSLFSLQSLAMALLLSLGVACSDQDTEQQAMVRQAAAIEQADECHLCGMIISRFPGPKGENYSKSTPSVNKFCSTRDLFSYILQPDNQRQVQEIYVHDMSKTPWQTPQDEYFMNAREAWYVIGSTQKGAMGKTLASFSREADANSFRDEFGGKVYRFDEISIEML